MLNKKLAIQFTVLTFCIAYLTAGILIFLGPYGYRVYNWVNSLQQFVMNIPFAVYIMSPAIASYIVLRKNNKAANLNEWLKHVFYVKNNGFPYLFVILGLSIYFSIHLVITGRTAVLPFYTLFLSLPGNLMIGGLEEAGWMYILQPELDKKYGYVLSSVYTGLIWMVWHIPLFFIAGTNHGEGLIDWGMFNIQLMSFRFFNGAIYKISGKSRVFMCVLFHTLFNAASPVWGDMTMTWPGTIAANTALILIAVITVAIYEKKQI